MSDDDQPRPRRGLPPRTEDTPRRATPTPAGDARPSRAADPTIPAADADPAATGSTPVGSTPASPADPDEASGPRIVPTAAPITPRAQPVTPIRITQVGTPRPTSAPRTVESSASPDLDSSPDLSAAEPTDSTETAATSPDAPSPVVVEPAARPQPSPSATGPDGPTDDLATAARSAAAQPAAIGRRSERHRADSRFRSGLGWTVLGSIVPGLGLIHAGRRRLGGIILGLSALLLLTLVVVGLTQRQALLAAATSPDVMRTASVVLIVAALLWATLVVITHLAVRAPVTQAHRIAGGVVVALLTFLLAAPLAVGARYAQDSATAVGSVFKSDKETKSVTRPTETAPPNAANPWEGKPRVNVLLLGGDGGDDRDGVRTDTVILASIDTTTGDTTLFSLPRNTARMPFPAKSKLHALYPYGFTNGDGDNAEYMLNAMYRNIPAQHPGILGETDNEGADVLKLSVGEALGLKVDYYALVNLDGFTQLVNALGGVTVNINKYIPVGGSTDPYVLPNRYLTPGPNQHLKGKDALWYARGRFGLDDFDRMDRQRCVINAAIRQINPQTLLTRYEAIAKASSDIVLTDVPQERLSAFLELGLKVKDADVRSVVFVSGKQGFVSSNPDYDAMRSRVKKALGEAGSSPKSSKPKSSSTPKASSSASASGPSNAASESPTAASENANDSCAWQPEVAATSTPGPTRVR